MKIFMPIVKNMNFIHAITVCTIILTSNVVHSETTPNESSNIKRTYTLWSSNESCFKNNDPIEDGAIMIAVESFGDTYKVAACAPMGCRISVPEFGKKTHQGNFRHDQKFTWLTDTTFEAKVYGQNTIFYHCLTK